MSLGLAAALALAASPLLAAPSYVFSNATSSNIPGLTEFTTTGATMNGMSVTAEFVGGGSDTRSWAATGAISGGVAGPGGSLTQAGETFANPWDFSFTGTTVAQLQRLILTGSTGLTVFDVDIYNDQASCDTYTPTGDDRFCSPGSARGVRMIFADTTLSSTVTYSDIVGLAGAGPVGDLFNMVTIDFGSNGIRTSFSFLQDTDNDSRFAHFYSARINVTRWRFWVAAGLCEL